MSDDDRLFISLSVLHQTNGELYLEWGTCHTEHPTEKEMTMTICHVRFYLVRI